MILSIPTFGIAATALSVYSLASVKASSTSC